MLVAILLCGAGSAWGETTEVLTLDCATPAPSGTTSTALSNSNDVATFLNSAAGLSSATNIITCSDKSGDIYKGKGSGGGAIPQQCLKVGKASGGGSFTFTIPSTYDPIDVIELTCYGWKTTSSISINSGTAQTFSTAQSVMTKTFELSAPSRDITIAVTTSAVCITEIVLKKSSSGGSNLQASDLALGSSALSFDLYNNSAAQTVSYTTSSTGAVTVSGGTGYVTTSVNGNTITVTPTAVTPSTQTIIVSQAADDTYAAGSASFTVTVDDSTPFVGSYFIFNTDKGLSDLGITKPGNSAGTDLDADVDYTIGDVTMNVTHGSGTNTRVWAGTNGATDLRVYKGGTLKFTVPTGYSIKKITFAGSAINIIGLTDGIWTPSGDPVNTVSLTNNDTGSKINTITVEYESDNTPMISAGDVNLTYNETSGSINYSVLNPVAGGAVTAVSSENWLTVGTPSNGTIAISCSANNETTERTATVTLTYTYGDNETVTKTVTVTQAAAPVSYSSIPALFEAATSTETAVNVTFNNWVVSGVSTNGKNVFVTDNAGNGFVIYSNEDQSSTYSVGSILSGTAVPCTLKKYSGYAELLNVNASNLTITTGGIVAVQNIALADLAGVNTGALVSYENLTCSVENNKYYLSDGTTSLQVYNSLFAFEALEAGKTYNITGVYQQYNTTKEILPRSADDIEEVAAAVETPTFTPAAGTYTEAQNVTIACETEGATIKYSFDNETWQDYSAAIQLSEYGTFTIYAKAVKGTDESTVASATYTIEDPNAPGTENNPYTVAQARAAIDAGTGITGVYVKGIVSGIVTAFNSQYGNISFNISDDGTTTADQLEAYRCFKGASEVHFTSEDDIQVGDEVVLFGNLTLYNSTYELAAGNYLVSLTRPEPPVVPTFTLSFTSDTAPAELAHIPSGGSIYFEVSNYEGTDFHAVYCDAQGNTLEDNPYAEWFDIFYNNDDPSIIYYLQYYFRANNTSSEPRFAYARLYVEVDGEKYYSDIVTFKQEGYVAPNFAELPFEFDGGKADVETTDGLTQEGLDSDYGNSPKLKFNGTGDYVLLAFNEQPGTLTFDIKGNTFSGGTFTVQTSEDGVTFTNLASYTELGDTQSEEFDNLGENVRYIKWVYTQKSSGNVALGNIKLAKYVAPANYDLTVALNNGISAIFVYNTADETNPLIAEGAAGIVQVTAGTEIMVSPDVAEGYQLASLIVDEEDVTSQIDETGAYTFTMPGHAVAISATATENVPPITGDKYVKVTSDEDLTSGQYLIVYEEGSLAFNGGLETLDASGNTIEVVLNNSEIAVTDETAAAEFTLDVTAGSIKSASGLYIGQTSDANGLQSSATEAYTNTLSLDEDGNADILSSGGAYLRYNATSGQNRFRYYKSSTYSSQKAIQLYKKVIKGDVNGDGAVTIADVTALVNIILGKDTEGVYDHEAANVNGDEGITIADVTALVNIILGKNQN